MKLVKFGRWTVRKILFYPVALVLAPLVASNYRKRQEGKLPDEWYWADIALMKNGFGVSIK